LPKFERISKRLYELKKWLFGIHERHRIKQAKLGGCQILRNSTYKILDTKRKSMATLKTTKIAPIVEDETGGFVGAVKDG
jgi:hypothetical protein